MAVLFSLTVYDCPENCAAQISVHAQFSGQSCPAKWTPKYNFRFLWRKIATLWLTYAQLNV